LIRRIKFGTRKKIGRSCPSRNGQLLPEVQEVIRAIAKLNLVLATGHSSAEGCLMVIREARRRGVRNIVVTHAMAAPVRMTTAQMQEAAREGMQEHDKETSYRLRKRLCKGC